MRGTQQVAGDRTRRPGFHNGPLLPMDDQVGRAEALAVHGDRILAVGPVEMVRRHVGPGTQMVDLKGRALLPGFVDPHVHTAFVQFDD